MSQALSLAGFQVTLIGRFWVIPEVDSPSGPLRKDFESFDEARDLADRMSEEYL
jgi:hypothetical protein